VKGFDPPREVVDEIERDQLLQRAIGCAADVLLLRLAQAQKHPPRLLPIAAVGQRRRGQWAQPGRRAGH
jgi:hypothetical protein